IKKVDRVDTIGARGVVKPIKDLTGSLEMAYQFGKYVTPTGAPSQAVADRKAWALEAAVNYAKPERKYAPSLTALYSYFSGDVWNESSYATTKGTYRGWDPMFENQTTGSIANALFNQTNAHVLGGIASVKPKDDVTVKGEYYAYWWAKKFGDQAVIPTARNTSDQIVMHSKRFAGQEMDLTAIYDYTEDVQFSLMGGILIPGASFDNKNNNPATEVIGSMKVTF
ncbi:MAG TPA: alginate export family protein, partial [Candidatus Margulisiibacteriota bacterium]|nr:alginate export family protein [Candidatus Margulisiibacteriota bacterium]